MSEEWQYFPCTIKEKTAFVLVDLGIQKEMETLGINVFHLFHIQIKEPNDDGFPVGKEAEVLKAFEREKLKNFLLENEGINVGRITTDAKRYIYVYMELNGQMVQEWVDQAHTVMEHQITVLTELDPKKERYWQELFPTDKDFRVIADLMVIETLEKNGDILVEERLVEHFFYFETKENAAVFQHWLLSEGYLNPTIIPTEGGAPRFMLKCGHRLLPQLGEINQHTLNFLEKVEEYQGEYDGWETFVVKPKNLLQKGVELFFSFFKKK